MAGMKATASGHNSFLKVKIPEFYCLGRLGDFLRESRSEGEIWQYSAAHLGADEIIYEITCDILVDRRRAGYSD